MLDDNIVTTFEITNSLKASFQLSKVFQSIAVNNGNYLILDSYAVNGMKAIDLSNPKQLDTLIIATGHRVVLLEYVIKSLSIRFNIKTGKILLKLQPKPIPQIQPIKKPISQPKPIPQTKPIPKMPKQQLKKDPNICLPGVVSCVSATLPKQEDKLCLPEEPCDIQTTNKPCLPGVVCTSTIEEKVMKDSLDYICLPGRMCLKTVQESLPGSFESIPNEDKSFQSTISTSEPCLPGMQCINSQDLLKNKTICLPGEIC
jgi:hypothetical protein